MRRKFEAHGYIRTCRLRAHDAQVRRLRANARQRARRDATHHATPRKPDASHAQATLDLTQHAKPRQTQASLDGLPCTAERRPCTAHRSPAHYASANGDPREPPLTKPKREQEDAALARSLQVRCKRAVCRSKRNGGCEASLDVAQSCTRSGRMGIL